MTRPGRPADTVRAMPDNGKSRPAAGVAIDRHKLRQLREDRGLTQTSLAARMSAGEDDFTISANTVGKLELGRRRPSPEVFRRLCETLGCDPAELKE